jgi:hypothetical protein
MCGNMRFMRGLQPGRQPHATPTPLSTDMMMKVMPPFPNTKSARCVRYEMVGAKRVHTQNAS